MIIKLKSKIYLSDWLMFKPYEKQAPTDMYYLKLGNRVKNALEKSMLHSILSTYLPNENINEELNRLACFLTSYFEDLISETNLWCAFFTKHQQMYSKPLPFYDTTDYYEGEINQQDVNFLIWYFVNCVQDENYIEPVQPFLKDAAEKVMVELEAAWETAPENENLQAYYRIDEFEKDYYKVKQFTETILFYSYLFFPDTGLKAIDRQQSIQDDKRSAENQEMFLYDDLTSYVHAAKTQLLSMSGQEWAAAILGEQHQLSEALLKMSKRLTGLFLYKGQDEEYVHIEHIASSKKFAVTIQSIQGAHLLKEIDTIVCMGIIKWKKQWWFSGAMFQQPYSAAIVSEQKKSQQSIKAVNFLDEYKRAEEATQKYLKYFLQFNKGSQIAFMPTNKIDEFVVDFYQFYNNTIRFASKENEEKYEKMEKQGAINNFAGHQYFSNLGEDSPESGLVFFNPKSGLEMALGINSAFPMPNNPFYNVEESEECIFSLLEGKEFSKELVMYCMEHCKDDLYFFNYDANGERYLKDLDFLLRFWKAEAYHSKPTITLIERD